jgi:hypothetical protein
MWLPPNGKVPDLERIPIESKKVRLTIVGVSDGIRSRDCLRKWVQIQRGLLCEQSADTIV